MTSAPGDSDGTFYNDPRYAYRNSLRSKEAPHVISVKRITNRWCVRRNGRTMEECLSHVHAVNNAISLAKFRKAILLFYVDDKRPSSVRDFRKWKKGRSLPKVRWLALERK